MNPATVNALADHLATIDAQWREKAGYTGRSIHCKSYWQNMAARLLHDSLKSIPPQNDRQRTPPAV